MPFLKAGKNNTMMKYALVSICLLLAGCTCGGRKQYEYRFRNESGRRVAVVVDELDDVLPDSLVIGSGETYDWGNNVQRYGFFPLRTLKEIKVYYGDHVQTVLTPADERSPLHLANYAIHPLDEYYFRAVYTFTVQDYENALNESAR